MVKFENALDVEPLDDGCNWLVTQNFYYDSDILCAGIPSIDPVAGAGSRICVSKGFVTDFASIPRPLWWLVGAPAEGKYRKIAPVHDMLYRTLGLATRTQADAVLLEGMKTLGVNWCTRTLVYYGVRIGGGCSYKGGL